MFHFLLRDLHPLRKQKERVPQLLQDQEWAERLAEVWCHLGLLRRLLDLLGLFVVWVDLLQG